MGGILHVPQSRGVRLGLPVETEVTWAGRNGETDPQSLFEKIGPTVLSSYRLSRSRINQGKGRHLRSSPGDSCKGRRSMKNEHTCKKNISPSICPFKSYFENARSHTTSGLFLWDLSFTSYPSSPWFGR